MHDIKKGFILNTKNKKNLLLKPFIFIVLLILSVSLTWHSWLPWLANHLSFALPGQRGLPYSINFNGRSYINHSTCAYADWCRSEDSLTYPRSNDSLNELCIKVPEIQQLGDWPLIQVATTWTLGGTPQPVLTSKKIIQEHSIFRGTSQLSIKALYIPRENDCYAIYGLSGGP